MYVWKVGYYADGNSDHGWVIVDADSESSARNVARDHFYDNLEKGKCRPGDDEYDEIAGEFEKELAVPAIVPKAKVRIIRNQVSFDPDE